MNRAVAGTFDASLSSGDRKVGLIWRRQGSGKSWLMALFAGHLVRTSDTVYCGLAIQFLRVPAEIVLPSGVSRKSVSRAATGLTDQRLIHCAAAPYFRFDFRK